MSEIRTNAAVGAVRQGRRTGFSALLSGALAQIGTWQRRSSERRALGALPPHLLKDLGIDAADAQREASKPFWRA